MSEIDENGELSARMQKLIEDGQVVIKRLKELQALINQIKEFPEYREYVKQHKLKLIDGALPEIDEALDKGIVKA